MSDNIKLVIEIPKDIYARCKEYKLWSYDAETLEGAVATSKPLSVPESTDLISREEAQKALYGCVMPNKHAEDILAEVSSADIMECARAIKEYCKGMKKCDTCPFGQNIDIIHGCDLRDIIPECWALPERGNK